MQMENPKTLQALVLDAETYLRQRGNSPKAISHYHYIFQVFISYFNSFHEVYFSEAVMDRCLREHYRITDTQVLSRSQHYKKIVLRASNILRDLARGQEIKDRYIESSATLAVEEFNTIVAVYCKHLKDIGRSQKTIISYSRYVSRFLDFSEKCGTTAIADFTAGLIQDYCKTMAGRNKATIKSALGPVGIFLRFLYTTEYIQQDLSPFVGSVQMRDQTRIPSVWNKEDVLKLLAAIDRGNPSGKRDYAIILLVARLGIRVGDVTSLKFEHIDWKKNQIVFIQRKTHQPIILPLLKDVGWAIIDYVQNGRPKFDSPYIFLTHVPPYKGFAGENHLHATVRKYMVLTDIQDQPRKKRGMHSLRYSLANRLMENHETAHTISSVLGHTSPDSASVYIKTDIELLRGCALSPQEEGI